jgi:hypothetical protein
MAKVRCDDRIFLINPTSVWELLRKLRPGSGYTCHGFRSSLRDFVDDQTHFDRRVAEAALAHFVAGVEGGYRRGDVLEKRRQLMAFGLIYCCGVSPDNVVALVG